MKDLIDALGVLVNPNASDEDKAAALDKLTAYFNSQLESQETQAATESAPDESKPDVASEAGDADGKDKDDKSKEMSSALSGALEQIKALSERMTKMEKASAVGSAPRAAKPTVIPRKDPPAAKDYVVSMIEAAERNTIRNLSK